MAESEPAPGPDLPGPGLGLPASGTERHVCCLKASPVLGVLSWQPEQTTRLTGTVLPSAKLLTPETFKLISL